MQKFNAEVLIAIFGPYGMGTDEDEKMERIEPRDEYCRRLRPGASWHREMGALIAKRRG